MPAGSVSTSPPRSAAPARTGGSSPAADSAPCRPFRWTSSDLSTSADSREHRGSRSSSGADRLGRLQRAAAGEHRQPPEQDLLGLGEQVVAPVDGRAASAGGAAPSAAPPVSSRKRSLEPRRDLLGAEEPRPAPPPARSPAASRPAAGRSRPPRRVLGRQREVRSHRGRPLDEQPHRLASAQRPTGPGRSGTASGGHRQSPRRRRRAAPGWSPGPSNSGQARSSLRPARRRPPPGARSCPAPAAVRRDAR